MRGGDREPGLSAAPGTGQGDQRNGGIVKPQIHRYGIVIARSAIEEIDVIAEVLLEAHAGIQMMEPRQPGFSGDVIAARHALLLDVRAIAPASKGLIIVG